MGMQLKDLRKQDYKAAIQYAIKGMHLDWYVNTVRISGILNSTGQHR